MHEKLIIVTGGTRSGKSSKALALAAPYQHKLFIATATPSDEEMTARIARHRSDRGNEWTTVEPPCDLVTAMSIQPQAVAVVDCMTLWLASALERGLPIDATLDAFLAAAARRLAPVIVVTNEVGLGIVPPFESGRRFRDLAGLTNQRLAAAADVVLFMVSGLELRLKGD